MKNLNKNGINALDLTGDKITATDLISAEEMIKMNYGNSYAPEKFKMLWSLIKDEGWTKERLSRTVKWFLKNRKFATWTVADWFDYSVNLYPYSWYLEQPDKSLLEAYKVNGVVLWKYIDDEQLPFEKVI